MVAAISHVINLDLPYGANMSRVRPQASGQGHTWSFAGDVGRSAVGLGPKPWTTSSVGLGSKGAEFRSPYLLFMDARACAGVCVCMLVMRVFEPGADMLRCRGEVVCVVHPGLGDSRGARSSPPTVCARLPRAPHSRSLGARGRHGVAVDVDRDDRPQDGAPLVACVDLQSSSIT